ncbi:MAG: F0F1 ATP synthase subunit B, partial [Clostridia bacterium]|nr:F0F1 ATP synthase subunit B [Clostridia bacterium]
MQKFLYKPVKNVLAKRQAELEEHYVAAENAEAEAKASREMWEEKLAGADAEADAILKKATDNASYRGDQIISDAKEQAESIIRIAKTEAELERKKAAEGVKREIVDLSGALTEKMLEREIRTEDHRALIDAFIEDIGDGND